jgi:dienelactone hydrolase
MSANLPDTVPRDYSLQLGDTPALLVVDGPEGSAVDRGTVVVLHGLTGRKELHQPDAEVFARRGFLVVLPDAVGHGVRRYPDFERRFSSPAQGERSYFDIVRRTAAELPGVISDLTSRGLARPGGLGAVGTSMGGAVLFGAMTAGCDFAAVATIVASPRWLHCEDSPHQRLERFYPTALLIQTAGVDTTVPPADVRALHAALVSRYAPAPERLRYIEYAGEEHMLPADGAGARARAEVTDWLDRFVKAGSG